MSSFKLTDLIYKNIQNTDINLVEIDNANISSIQRNVKQLFSTLDRDDDEQKKISLKVWLLRSSILFTLLDFDSDVLELSKQLDEIKSLSIKFPSIQSLVGQLENEIKTILEAPKNPKRTWLENSTHEIENDQIAIFTNLSSGRSPGWSINHTPSTLGDLLGDFTCIRTTQDFRNKAFDRVILPCGCANAPYHQLVNIVYSGISQNFDILLYLGEKFNFPKRLTLPTDEKLQSKFRKSVFQKNYIDVQDSSPTDTMDSWVNDSFWNELHSGSREFSASLTPANYILFSDGTGTFLPSNGKALVLIEELDKKFTENNLKQKNIEELSDGDLIIIRTGESGFLLDVASDVIMNDEGVDSLLEEATDWKSALNLLTMTYDWSQISEALRSENVHASTSTLQRWAGAEGLGPREEKDFKVLMQLLIKEKKITILDDVESYISEKWAKLRSLRGVRQKAGNMIRSELFDALSHKMSYISSYLEDKTVIKNHKHQGVELVVFRIFSIDQVESYVQTSQIGRLDDLRNNQWLG